MKTIIVTCMLLIISSLFIVSIWLGSLPIDFKFILTVLPVWFFIVSWVTMPTFD